MTKMKIVFATVACLLGVLANQQETSRPKNTIFGDEKFEGQVFEHLDDVFTRTIATRDDDNPYRLPTNTKPNRYNVLISYNFPNFFFGGTVAIELEATEANVNEIVIHSDGLNIISSFLTQGTVNIPVNVVEEVDYHFLRFQLQTGVLAYNVTNPVPYTLTVNFEGTMRTDMTGIYRSWFRTNGTTRWMASTHFQATAARRAFPCYDEPTFKSYFDITIRRPIMHRSWSCMRISNTVTSVVQGFEDDIYYTTPFMSTYLLAIVVAEYDSLEVFNNQNQLIYEVVARPDALTDGQGQYALEVGQELLAVMSDHTGIDFYSFDPNIKMTQASIPDFSAGAMENWGLLVYREAYLMYSEEHTNSYYKQLIAYILSHEIAHMWFGNLVTCNWWDILWMNEGFARYYQYFLTHWVEGYMDLETRFITEQVHTSLLSDSANNPHPLTSSGLGSPVEVRTMFTTITYNKGASVIRMTEHLLGFDIHREGLRNYLTQNMFGNVLPINLFQALQDVANSTGAIAQYGPNFSVIDYYESWTVQPGHPVLNVQVNHETGDMTIQQRRFNINSGYSEINNNYVVPITFSSASNPDFVNTKPSHILTDTVTVVNRGSVGDEWVIFNKQQIGFYRINYDEYTWNLIVLALKGSDRTLIHEYNRAQIVDDVFSFARSGLMTYNRAFNILSFLENETAYAPWVAAVNGFSWIRNRLAGSTQLTQIEDIIESWATTVMNSITYYPTPNEEFMTSYLRYQLAPVMCSIGVPACRTAATAQFAALRDNGVEIPVDSRNYVYCNALRDGTVEDFNFLWERFQTHHVYTEKIVLLQTLGCTPHENSLTTFLNGIMQENEVIRPQDYTTAFNTAVTGNEVNTQIVFRYIQANLNLVSNAFGGLATPLSYISARLRSEQEINDFITWTTTNQVVLGDSYQTILAGAESSRQSLQWAQSVADDLNDYFVNGDQQIEVTTPQETTDPEVITEAQPDIVEPVTPAIPDSGAAMFVSIFVLIIAAVANVVF